MSGVVVYTDVDRRRGSSEVWLFSGLWFFSYSSSPLVCLPCLPVRGSSPSADPIVYLSGFLSSDTRPNKTAPLGVGTPDRVWYKQRNKVQKRVEWGGKKKEKQGAYLDAEWCAALEELLYVVQALAVVFGLLVDLRRRKTQVRRTLPASGRSQCAFLGSRAQKMGLRDRHAFSTHGKRGPTLSGRLVDYSARAAGKWRRQRCRVGGKWRHRGEIDSPSPLSPHRWRLDDPVTVHKHLCGVCGHKNTAPKEMNSERW